MTNIIDPIAEIDEARVADQDVVIGKSRIIFRRFMRNRTAVAGLFIFLALFLFSIFGGFLTSWDKDTLDPLNIGMPPSPDHLLGDHPGRHRPHGAHCGRHPDVHSYRPDRGRRFRPDFGGIRLHHGVLRGGKVDATMLFILEALIMMPAILVVAVATSGSGGLKDLPAGSC